MLIKLESKGDIIRYETVHSMKSYSIDDPPPFSVECGFSQENFFCLAQISYSIALPENAAICIGLIIKYILFISSSQNSQGHFKINKNKNEIGMVYNKSLD